MEKEIPKVNYSEDAHLNIEVMNLKELYTKLNLVHNHDPFSVHRIRFYLILIVTDGSYSHFVDFTNYQLAQGSTLFIAKNQVHHFTHEMQKADGFCIIFNSQFIEKDYLLSGKFNLSGLFNYHIVEPVIHEKDINEKSFIDFFAHLFDEYKQPDSYRKPEILSALLHILILKAERAIQFKSLEGIKTQWMETFNKFKNLLERDYKQTRSSRAYAAKLLISYKSLNEIVKKLSGRTVKTFIDEFVIMEIKRYLASTSHSVKEISYLTGFDEPSNMVNFFKKYTATTPLKFKQQF